MLSVPSKQEANSNDPNADFSGILQAEKLVEPLTGKIIAALNSGVFQQALLAYVKKYLSLLKNLGEQLEENP